MGQIIDMQFMRYINLFEKISHVSTTNCFVYNNIIIFAVPKPLVSKAIGKNGANAKRIGELLKKKIKIIAMPKDISRLKDFIDDIVEPVVFSKLELKGKEVIISGGNRQTKATLIGRDRVREKELGDVLAKSFGITKFRVS